MKVLSFMMAAVLVAAPASAQIQVEKRRPAPANGELDVESSFGSVTIHAWEQNEVLVKGTLAAGAEGLELDGDEESVYVDVYEPDHWFYGSEDDSEYQSHLEVYAPMGSSVEVETVNGTVVVRGFNGAELDIETVNGAVLVDSNFNEVDIETMTGQVEVQVPQGAEIWVETISGPVVVQGATGEVEVESVSGDVNVTGWDMSSVDIETTSGGVTLRGGLAAEGDVDIETFSGQVALVFRPDVKARFELTTFGGEIRNSIGPSAVREDSFSPNYELRFNTGLEEFDVSVSTHNSDITLTVEE